MFFTTLRTSKRRQTRKHFVKHQLIVESLEERTLLDGSGLVGAVGTKDDSLAKLDTTLAATLREYQAHPGADAVFEASAPLLQIGDGKVVVDAVASGDVGSLLDAARAAGVPAAQIGVTGGPSLTLPGGAPISLSEMRAAHESWLPRYMGE